ncbi:MAG: class I SAM-dependent methyltransferase [Simkaniaceae bacterium]
MVFSVEDTYELLDSGEEKKLERFGDYVISRPAGGAIWKKSLPEDQWQEADAVFSRDRGSRWQMRRKLPQQWEIQLKGIRLKISPTDFGHLGAFPEHSMFWPWAVQKIQAAKRKIKVLNLFAYSGGATLAFAKAGAEVCHVDASKGMISWARENAALNHLSKAPVRWIVDDAAAFLKREQKRKSFYDAIVLDPPSFGRGNKGQVFKIESSLAPLLDLCRRALSDDPLFIILTCHTPGITPISLRHMLHQEMGGCEDRMDCGEMLLEGKNTYPLPSGSYARMEF